MKMSDATIRRILKEHKITTKKLYHIPSERNTPETIENRKKYVQEAQGWHTNDLVFIDETGFNLHLARGRGRCTIGERATYETANSRGGNISVCAALSPKRGIIHYKVKLGAFNAEEFIIFLRELFSQLAFQSRVHHVVMDNVRFHKTEAVKAVFSEGVIQHELHYLPPYSPQLNPIENCFSKIKNYVKQKEKNTQAQLLTLIAEAVGTITAKDTKGYYRKVQNHWYIQCAFGERLV